MPNYNDCTPEQRNRWRIYLSQRFEKPKSDVKPSDWDRANGWRIPNLVYVSLDAALRPIEVERANSSWVDIENGVLRIPRGDSSKNVDNWQADVVRRCIPRDYDEECRLLCMAMTRAKSRLVFSAGETPNTFIEELPVEVRELVPDVGPVNTGGTVQTRLQISVPTLDGPIGQSPHSLMRDNVFEDTPERKETEFSIQVHEFAEQYAKGDDVTPSDDSEVERNVKEFIDSLDGKLRVEDDAYLPLDVDGERVSIYGIVDIAHLQPDRVEIIDFKTDRGRYADTEYRKQLSVYYHVLSRAYPDREVTAKIFYTEEGETATIDPISEAAPVSLVRERL